MEWPRPTSLFPSTKILHGIGYEKLAFYKTFNSNVNDCALNNKYWGKRAPVVGSICKDEVRTRVLDVFAM